MSLYLSSPRISRTSTYKQGQVHHTLGVKDGGGSGYRPTHLPDPMLVEVGTCVSDTHI